MKVAYKTLKDLLSSATRVKEFLIRGKDHTKEVNEAFEVGEQSGEKCFISKLDDQFRWRKGYVYCFTGFPGTGKSEFVNYLAILQAQKKGIKIGMYSPENYPIYNLEVSLMKSYLGKNISKGYNNQCNKQEFDKAFEFINDHFYFLKFNDMPKLSQLLDCYQMLADECGCRMFITDPFNAIADGGGDNIAQHLRTALTQMKLFADNYQVYNVIVEHPRSPTLGMDGSLPRPSPWSLYGGSMWWNKMDCIVSLERDMMNSKADVIVRTWKMKLQRLNGQPGEQILYYDVKTGRYNQEPF